MTDDPPASRTPLSVKDLGPAAPEPSPDGSAEDVELLARRTVALRHPWRWLATAIVMIVVAQFLHGLISNPFYEWGRFRYWFLRPVILDGLVITLKVTAWSAVLGFVGGVVLALGRPSKSPLLRITSWAYIWLFRSIPLIVLLLILYNFSAIYPQLSLGIPFGPGFARFQTTDLLGYTAIGVLGLSLNEAAYAAEVVRAGTSRSTRASTRRPTRWGWAGPGSSAGSSCRRRCGRSCRPTSTS